MRRRIGPVLLVGAGVAGLLTRYAGVDIFPAPVLGVLLAVVVAVDAGRRRPVGSVIAAVLVGILLAAAFGVGGISVPPGLTASALLVAGVFGLVGDQDPELDDVWSGLAVFVPRRVELERSPRVVSVTTVFAKVVVELSEPRGVVEVRAACLGGTVDLVVPGDWDVLIGDLDGRDMRFSGESDGLWDGLPKETPTVVLRTAGRSGSVIVRKTALEAR
ncbi:hypothetical protein Sya03_18220 [Spirilliplanes yamanashiensis]|uniref:Cell wall-active antibiotics response LiaF-like C-terminal domain-containing protein n=1 Tax=Spirilliplanes yamanashiensis TaxID=42233 RepID=A0A8J3Y704_9ACTN|nr:hypothetical protein Sya03_18220 [Spirilliplanes yamanashiensis]